MTTDQFNQSVTDSIKNLVNKDLGLQEAESPNESTETGDDSTPDKYTLGPDCDSGCLDQGVRVCGHEYQIKHQYGQCPQCGGDHHETWCPDNNEPANKAKLPTSFSDWLEQSGDSIEIDDKGGNFTPDRIEANHDIYKNGNPFQ